MSRWLLIVLLLLPPAAAGQGSGGRARLIAFEQDGKWGYKDDRGRVTIKPQFLMAEDFSPEGIAPVVDDGGWAYINADGKVVIRPFVVDNGPDYFSDGLARFVREGKVGFFSKRGRVVIAAKFDFVRPFSEGLAAFCEGCREKPEGEHRMVRGGKWGFINRTGETVIPPKFDEVEVYRNGQARAKLDGQWHSIDRKGRSLTDDQFELTDKPQEAVLIVSYGRVGGMGEAVLDPQTGAIRFYSGLPIFVDSEFVRKHLQDKLPDHWSGPQRVRIAANVQLVKKTERNPSIPGAPEEIFWEVRINKLHEIRILPPEPASAN